MRLRYPALCVLLLVTLPACGGKRQEPPADSLSAADDADWKWLLATKGKLDGKRAELAAARARGAAAGGRPSPALAPLEREVALLDGALGRRLVDFINAHPPLEGEKLEGRQLAAMRMKSDEDIARAHELIAQGGDYRRALDVYESALAVDPDNPRLQRELESARARRYMTAERFAEVKKGMTEDEVRALLGQPNLNNVRDYPERGVTAWFYTKDSAGSAAAVWFEKQSGGPVVYRLDFHAVEPQQTPAAAATPGR